MQCFSRRPRITVVGGADIVCAIESLIPKTYTSFSLTKRTSSVATLRYEQYKGGQSRTTIPAILG